jgi:hypothetical protein
MWMATGHNRLTSARGLCNYPYYKMEGLRERYCYRYGIVTGILSGV